MRGTDSGNAAPPLASGRAPLIPDGGRSPTDRPASPRVPMPGPEQLGQLNTLEWRRLQEFADRFHEARERGQPVDFEPYLPPPDSPLRRVVLQELIIVDLELRWQQVVTRQEILDMVASRSYVISMPAPDRAALLGEVTELLDEHPDLRGRAEIALPYIARCTRVRLAGPGAA